MKRTSSYLMLLFITIGTFLSCKKMDSTYRKYIVPGGITYTGKAVAPIANSGHNRIKISWLKGSDPNVVKTRIFWNNYTDSVEINILPGVDTMSTIINNLPEKSYSFFIKTYDAKGNSSVPEEILGNVYGDNYQASLLSRPIVSSIMDAQGRLDIEWGDADLSNGAYAMEVAYTDTLGQQSVHRFAIDQSSTILSDYKGDSTFKFRTVYLPDSSSIDTFYTAFIIRAASRKIDKSTWIATADSYTPTRLLPSGPPKCAIDGNINTFWHSLYPSTTVIYPHWLAINMKQVINVSNVELTYRQNVFTSFTDFMIQGSLDGVNWTTYGSFNFLLLNDPQRYSIPNSPMMQYIRIYMTKGPNAYANLAELSVYGYQ